MIGRLLFGMVEGKVPVRLDFVIDGGLPVLL